MNRFDAIVVGCGLSGAVIARCLAEQGKRVEIWERRDHIGGNMYDSYDEYGILVQQYGPHTFHTNRKELYDYMWRFGNWREYKLVCGAVIDGKCTPTPFNFQTIDDFYAPGDAAELKQHIRERFGERQTATVVEVLNDSDEVLRKYAQFLFEKDYSLYTAKQWGVPPSEIDPSVLKRVPLRFSYETGYFDDIYQVMPERSFTDFFKALLAHKNISVRLGVEALDRLRVSKDQKGLLLDGEAVLLPIVYTGALDELFDGVYGRLPYRSLRFEWKHEAIQNKQAMPVVAYPQETGYTRITEYNKLPQQLGKGTTYAIEYPLRYEDAKKQEPYYPVLTENSQKQYASYLAMANAIPNLYPCGRLGDFKYYNMDQALARALEVCAFIDKPMRGAEF